MMDHVQNNAYSFNLNSNINIQSKNNINSDTKKINSADQVTKNNTVDFAKKMAEERAKAIEHNDYFTQKQISNLAEKFEKYHIYTKEASKIVAEQIIKGAIEFIA